MLSWVGIGFGDSMIDTDIYVGWKNSTGGYIISRRKASSYSLPAVNPDQIGSLASDLTVSKSVPSPNISFSFLVPKSSLDTSNTNYVYAYSNTPPFKPDDLNSAFSRHSSVGDFVADFTAPFTPV